MGGGVDAAAKLLAGVHLRRRPAAAAAVRANLDLLGAPGQADESVRAVFLNFWRSVLEFAVCRDAGRLDVAVEGAEHLAAARRTARGVIMLTCHLGNWELGAAVVGSKLGGGAAAVALPHRHRFVDRLFVSRRRALGVMTIPPDEGVIWRSLEHLRRGGVLGLLADGRFVERQRPVDLQGCPVPFAEGPASLSRRTGAWVIPSAMVRTGSGRFRLLLGAPIMPRDPAGRLRGGGELTEAYAAALFQYLVRYPTQWALFEPAVERLVPQTLAGQTTAG
jgi:KDO2-lipid IV(A) lauroyltransferase